jgi:hypothetical protein
MFKLKGCPRCRGALVFDKDQYGLYEHCLCCGYLHDLATVYLADPRLNKSYGRGEPIKEVGNRKRPGRPRRVNVLSLQQVH